MTSKSRAYGWLAWSLVCLTSCSDRDTANRAIGGHTFKIPKKNLADERIFFLPNSQGSAIRFVVNPESTLRQQILVSVDQHSSCPRTEYEKRTADRCRAVAVSVATLETEGIVRVNNPADRTQWEYKTARSKYLTASCSTLENQDGLCMHDGLYRDLTYTVHLHDSQMPHLVDIRKTIDGQLASWESMQR
jgi:hypothetical protein